MARKVITTFVDDIDGTQIDEAEGTTIGFAIDGVSYEIDLKAENATKLRESLAPYVAVARRTPGTKQRSGYSEDASARRAKLDAIRRWARENGHAVSDRGRISASIVAAFESQTN